MLNAHHQFSLIHQWLDKISTHLVYYMATREQEDIHRMRVETKKIKALITLSELCSGRKDNSSSLYFLNSLYKVAGKIREAYLNVQLFKDIQGQDLFIGDQKILIGMHSNTLQEMIPFYLINLEKNIKKLKGKIRDIRSKCIVDTFQQYRAETALLIKPNASEEGLHEGRKKIKFLQYNYRIIAGRVQKELALDTVYLDRLQEFIGSWHDSLVYLNLLKQLPGIEQRLITFQQEKTNSLAELVYEEGKEFRQKLMQPDNTLGIPEY